MLVVLNSQEKIAEESLLFPYAQLTNSSTRFNNPTLCLMIPTLSLSMKVTFLCFDGLGRTSIEIGNPLFFMLGVRSRKLFQLMT